MTKKATEFMEILRLFIGRIPGRGGLIDNDVINDS
jgi:hypothetical protein